MTRVVLLLALLLVGVGCATQPPPPEAATGGTLVFLTRAGCVNTDIMRANLDEALGALRRPLNYEVVDLDTLSNADSRRGYPTPTVLYDNRDVFGLPEPQPPFPDPT